MWLRDSRNEDRFILRASSSNMAVVLASAGITPEVGMSTFKYLSVVAAVLAASFFLAQSETGLATNTYADVMPAAISDLPIFLQEAREDKWHEAHKAVCLLTAIRPCRRTL
jgi:hypothetical protein